MQSNHKFTFRWPIKQIDEKSVDMIVPRGHGPSILNVDFCKSQQLSDLEIDVAEDAVIREIAIIK